MTEKLFSEIKEQLLYFENFIKTFTDNIITQYFSLSFFLSGNVEKTKKNPKPSLMVLKHFGLRIPLYPKI